MTAAVLVTDLRARGVTLEPRGDKLAVRPVSRLRPEELEALRRHKAEVLRLLADPTPAPPAPRARPAVRWWSHPWPDALPGLGARSVGPFDLCRGCGTGSWVRYGAAVVCLACARRHLATGFEGCMPG